jgi:hypothetical protein
MRRNENSPCSKKFMISKNENVSLFTSDLEVPQWHARRIQTAFVPSVQDLCNLKSLSAPDEGDRVLSPGIFVPSDNRDPF